ncbi:MAG: hypothetical protein M3P08_10780 [Thermoproteota archaeon]|nr:hypothetical protein [Thermoproteota archaeon]
MGEQSAHHEYDGNLAATIGGGFFSGALIGFAQKKVLKIVAVVLGVC